MFPTPTPSGRSPKAALSTFTLPPAPIPDTPTTATTSISRHRRRAPTSVSIMYSSDPAAAGASKSKMCACFSTSRHQSPPVNGCGHPTTSAFWCGLHLLDWQRPLFARIGTGTPRPEGNPSARSIYEFDQFFDLRRKRTLRPQILKCHFKIAPTHEQDPEGFAHFTDLTSAPAGALQSAHVDAVHRVRPVRNAKGRNVAAGAA